MKTGIEQIAEERAKQLNKYSLAHDLSHPDSELLTAAVSYIYGGSVGRDMWPWEPESYNDEGYVENLKKAGALIAAVLDRLNLT